MKIPRRCRLDVITIPVTVSHKTEARFQQIAKSLGKDLKNRRQASQVAELIFEGLRQRPDRPWRVPNWVWEDDTPKFRGILFTQAVRLYQREH